MVKALTFKGDKKEKKKRKRDASDNANPTITDDGPSKPTRTDNPAGVEEDDDSWVSADSVADVVGPVMFVLPTTPPMSLACDATGKVFTLPIENIVDGNPLSAEPHDVRQVWVANKIVGTEHYRFKGHHGKYLRCDNIGILSATSDAISPLESFLIDTPPSDTASSSGGQFQIKTLRDTFVTTTTTSKGTPEVRGDATTDADADADTTLLRIRMQARFKPKLKAQKEEKAQQKISRRELEDAVGRKLEDEEIRKLKKARREGDYHELLLDMKVKNKHDKYG
ncbi:FRG1-like family-domain-containing protein [Diplogelasinospora grovesii]|uniref:FRG1-like family-domain-containing protein n=1 Tax=Diplogelasinospora grovesii TaxID=303347 RepID=A0AAN6NGP9_9PEZI|nr:FRG1-like family-domain-containing protein [Diplogelasinospora grovesii]